MRGKQIIRTVLALVLSMLMSPMAVHAGSIFVDVNGDGEVNIADVNAVIDYILSGNSVALCDICADICEDSTIDIGDVTLLIDRVLTGR